MADEQAQQPESLHFTQHLVLTVTAWPERILIGQAILDRPHAFGATVEDDTTTFAIFNGSATYRLTGEMQGDMRIAELVEGSATITRRKV